MSENYERFPVIFDDSTNAWVVTMPANNVSCATGTDAICIASIPELYKESQAWETFRNDKERLRNFIKRLDEAASTARSYYVNCFASRELEHAAKRIREAEKE